MKTVKKRVSYSESQKIHLEHESTGEQHERRTKRQKLAAKKIGSSAKQRMQRSGLGQRGGSQVDGCSDRSDRSDQSISGRQWPSVAVSGSQWQSRHGGCKWARASDKGKRRGRSSSLALCLSCACGWFKSNQHRHGASLCYSK